MTPPDVAGLLESRPGNRTVGWDVGCFDGRGVGCFVGWLVGRGVGLIVGVFEMDPTSRVSIRITMSKFEFK